METRAATIMRAMAAVTVIAAVIGLYAAQLQAAPAGIAAHRQNFTPFKQLVLGVHRYDSTNGYLPDVHPTCSMPATTRHAGDFAAAGRAVTVRPVRAAITMLAQQMPPETRIAPVGEAGLRRQRTHLQNPQRRPPPDRRILICPATFSAFNSPRSTLFSAEAIDDAKVVVIKRSALDGARRLRCRGRPAALLADHQLRIAAHAGSRLATDKERPGARRRLSAGNGGPAQPPEMSWNYRCRARTSPIISA